MVFRLDSKRCKRVHCVDLGESFQTHIYLQDLVSIQPRTSPLMMVEAAFVVAFSTASTSQPASGATLPGVHARYPVEIEAINVSQAFLFSRTDNYNPNNVLLFCRNNGKTS